MPDNKLPVTVPIMLHSDMSEALGEPFAISYLCGAEVTGYRLRPRTRIAAERLSTNPTAMRVLAEHGLTLGPSLAPHEREALPGREPIRVRPGVGQSWQAPAPIPFDERSRVGAMVRNLAASLRRNTNAMDFKRLARRPGETETQQAERLWPHHRVDRMP